jgi:hypothetical protein
MNEAVNAVRCGPRDYMERDAEVILSDADGDGGGVAVDNLT